MNTYTTLHLKFFLPGRHSKYLSVQCVIPLNGFPSKGDKIIISIYPMAAQSCVHSFLKCFTECGTD